MMMIKQKDYDYVPLLLTAPHLHVSNYVKSKQIDLNLQGFGTVQLSLGSWLPGLGHVFFLTYFLNLVVLVEHLSLVITLRPV